VLPVDTADGSCKPDGTEAEVCTDAEFSGGFCNTDSLVTVDASHTDVDSCTLFTTRGSSFTADTVNCSLRLEGCSPVDDAEVAVSFSAAEVAA